MVCETKWVPSIECRALCPVESGTYHEFPELLVPTQEGVGFSRHSVAMPPARYVLQGAGSKKAR